MSPILVRYAGCIHYRYWKVMEFKVQIFHACKVVESGLWHGKSWKINRMVATFLTDIHVCSLYIHYHCLLSDLVQHGSSNTIKLQLLEMLPIATWPSCAILTVLLTVKFLENHFPCTLSAGGKDQLSIQGFQYRCTNCLELCLHLLKVPPPSPHSRHIWKQNCSLLHTTSLTFLLPPAPPIIRFELSTYGAAYKCFWHLTFQCAVCTLSIGYQW